MLQSFKTKEAF